MNFLITFEDVIRKIVCRVFRFGKKS